MTSALSNPYELTVGGITCKVSPFGNGFYVSNTDLEKLHPVEQRKFKTALFEAYNAEQNPELDGIKVGTKKK